MTHAARLCTVCTLGVLLVATSAIAGPPKKKVSSRTVPDAGVARALSSADAGSTSDAGLVTTRDAGTITAAGMPTTFDAGLATVDTGRPSSDASTVALRTWTQQGVGSATFDGTGPAGLKVHGVAPATVLDDGTSLIVSLSILDIDTDNSVRNRHLKEDAQADTFPRVSLAVPLTQLKTLTENASSVSGTATGTFDLHGKSKAVTFTWSATCKAGTCAVTGSAPLSLTDFGIKVRSYLGVTVKPELTVGATFTIKR